VSVGDDKTRMQEIFHIKLSIVTGVSTPAVLAH